MFASELGSQCASASLVRDDTFLGGDKFRISNEISVAAIAILRVHHWLGDDTFLGE